MSTNKIVANALKARAVTNKSRRAVEKMREVYTSIQDALASLQYAKVIITREEREENEDVLDAVPVIDSLITQAKKMMNDFYAAARKGL